MLVRKPVVAGRFYPGNPIELHEEVQAYLARNVKHEPEKCWGAMLPHAGYMYCASIIGATLAAAALPSRLVILCPNHTGRGKMLGVWPEGAWITPLGDVHVDRTLADALIAADAFFEADALSHLGEHAIEVLLPFLQEAIKDLQIVPITVGTANPAVLKKAGHALAAVLTDAPDAGIVVSSDMNHYENHSTTLAKDNLALAKALARDPEGLLEVTEREKISMCGAPALALALFAGRELGLKEVVLTGHTTSGAVSGDFNQTVGYAGLLLRGRAARNENF